MLSELSQGFRFETGKADAVCMAVSDDCFGDRGLGRFAVCLRLEAGLVSLQMTVDQNDGEQNPHLKPLPRHPRPGGW